MPDPVGLRSSRVSTLIPVTAPSRNTPSFWSRLFLWEEVQPVPIAYIADSIMSRPWDCGLFSVAVFYSASNWDVAEIKGEFTGYCTEWCFNATLQGRKPFTARLLSCGQKAIWRSQQDTMRTMTTERKTSARTTCTCKLHMHASWYYNRKSTKIEKWKRIEDDKGKEAKTKKIKTLYLVTSTTRWKCLHLGQQQQSHHHKAKLYPYSLD